MKALAWLLLLLSSAASAVTAQAYIVIDQSGAVLLEKNADDVRSIASLTKLIGATAAIEHNQDELIEILPSDVRAGRMRSSPLRAGRSYSRRQLIELSLISSDNVAAIALARTTSPNPPQSITIVEGSGLDERNQASARALAEYVIQVPTDVAIASVKPVAIVGDSLRPTTNRLLGKPGWDFALSKTGYISKAGGCLVVVFRAGDRLLTAVLLGADVRQRWRDLALLRRQVDSSEFFSPAKPVTKRKRRYK